MKWEVSHSAAANAKLALPSLAEKYFKAGREAASGKASPKSLHRFRMKTKRFRYSLELFNPVYGPGLERRLETLRSFQDALGKVSDYQAVLSLVEGDGALEKQLRRALKRKKEEFRREWKAFDSAGQLGRWKAFLAGRSPRRVTRKPR